MAHDHASERPTTESELNAIELSAVGGFVGTVFGSRRGPAGAVVGGLLGGTVGYLAGAVAEESAPVARDVNTHPGTETDGPVHIDVGDDLDAESATDPTEDTTDPASDEHDTDDTGSGATGTETDEE